jgi:hypothetical protein
MQEMKERIENTRERGRRLLELVEQLGNVSEACRRLGVDRSEFYRARRRAARGADADRSPLAKPLALEQRILVLCLENPEWGCDRLAYYLTLKGEPVSSPTVQKILIRHGFGRKAAREAAAREANPRAA